jgi:hypothetical protein
VEKPISIAVFETFKLVRMAPCTIQKHLNILSCPFTHWHTQCGFQNHFPPLQLHQTQSSGPQGVQVLVFALSLHS